MPKNAYAKQLQHRIAQDRILTQRVIRQMTTDMWQIALGRLGYGAKRQKEFHDMFSAVYMEFADIFNTDVKDDPEIVYAKARMDRELAEYCGEYFVVWEGRYD